MNCLQKLAQWEDATEELHGEYFITAGGDSIDADGDIGDVSHDGAVIQTIASSIEDVRVPDKVMNIVNDWTNVGSGSFKDWLEENYPGLLYSASLNQLNQYDSESSKYERVLNCQCTFDERVAIENQFPGYLSYVCAGRKSGLPKDYAVERMGWIRVVDNLFTVWTVDDQKMRYILNHINYNVMDDNPVELTIYEASTDRSADFVDSELSEGFAAWSRKTMRNELDMMNMYGEGEARI